jgi:hypothetical protein
MEFLVLGYDGTDEGALERRLAVRPAHVELAQKLIAEGTVHYGGAILDESEKMIGTMIACSFPSRAELDAWLKIEPYVTGNVWQKIEVRRFKPGASFAKGAAR